MVQTAASLCDARTEGAVLESLLVTRPIMEKGLALVGRPRRGSDGSGRLAGRPDGCAGDICVFYEPSSTVVRLFGRVDESMRKEMLEAAFDVVGRRAPVRIDVAPGATVDPGALCFLRALTHHDEQAAAPGSAADRLRAPHAEPRPRPTPDAVRRVPAAR